MEVLSLTILRPKPRLFLLEALQFQHLGFKDYVAGQF